MSGIPGVVRTPSNIVTDALNTVVRFVRPDVDAIISAFLKAQTKLGKVIEREQAFAQRETQAIEDAYGYISKLMTSREARDKVVNRAYRIIHNIDGLVA